MSKKEIIITVTLTALLILMLAGSALLMSEALTRTFTKEEKALIVWLIILFVFPFILKRDK